MAATRVSSRSSGAHENGWAAGQHATLTSMSVESYEQEVRWLEQQPARTNAPVFYGSSSIRMWDQLALDFPEAAPVNRGFGGSTMEACSWYFWRLVKPLAPAALVLYAGDNDLGDGKSPEFVVEQAAHLLAQLDHLGADIPLMLLAIKPSLARWGLRAQIEETNAEFARMCARRPRSVFVDLYSAMLRDGHPRAELLAEDGLHLSAAGYELWASVLNEQRGGVF
jgi:lysophospholipase L1-like esterase